MNSRNPSLPLTMQAIEIIAPGGPEVLRLTQRQRPEPGPREVLIRHLAAGLNFPDVMQRKGLYAPPPGASDIPGLEVAGEIVALGAEVTNFKLGDHVAALISGGGYAQYSVADEGNTMPLPPGLNPVEAAAFPETFMTVWLNMFLRGGFKAGDTILIHGGTSDIGTTATMLANAGHGADIIIDIVAGDYVARNYAAAAMNGRIVQIGVMAGPARELDIFPMLSKRLTHTGSTLRSRTQEEKAALIGELKTHVWPLIESGQIKPQVYQTFAFEQAQDAHRLMDSSKHIGKIILTMDLQ